MKRFLKTLLLPTLPLLAGLTALILRLWLYGSTDIKGLLPAEHPAAGLVFLLTALTLGLLLLLCRKLPRPIRVNFPVEAVGAFAAAAGILCCDIFMAAEQNTLLLLPGCIGTVGFGLLGWFRLRGRPAPLVFSALIPIYMMVWPFFCYRSWSADTQLQNYFFQVLSAVFLILYAYRFLLTEAGQKPHWLTRFLGCAGGFLCLTCLPCDRWPVYVGMAVWCFSGCFRKVPHMALPQDVLQCIRALEDAGYATYAVGGCVRDAMLGKMPQDYDLCTAATPEEICDVFGGRTLIHNGEKHGTVGVVIRRQVYEITTFRTEGGYSDNRHPDWVKFVATIEEDLARRDFTINAMAYSPRTGYIDPFGGQDDLENGIVRCVGDPEQRFMEDSLRILRGVRFAARLGFCIDPNTERAMADLAPLMDSLARERIFDELCKILLQAKVEDLQRFCPILSQVIPELKPSIGFQQHSPHHAYDVFTHIAHVVAAAPAELSVRWAALLHDVAKPQTFSMDETGRGHFLGHAVQSAQTADDILRRLKAPTALREQVVFLIENHMLTLDADKKLLRRRLSQYGADNIRLLLALQKADFSSKGTGKSCCDGGFDQVETLLEEILAENACLQVRDLAVSGDDLMALGYEAGPTIGKCLSYLLDLVLEETVPNEKDALLEKAKAFLEE